MKKKTHANDEVFEGNGKVRLLTANLYDMAHSFVLQNVDLMFEECM
jgi:hypothetical protein